MNLEFSVILSTYLPIYLHTLLEATGTYCQRFCGNLVAV